MAAPFEDEVIKFIANRRPLKLAFLLVAAIGVLTSAYKTIEPVVQKAQPLVYRLLDVELSPADRERLSCAYFTGGAQWDIPSANRIATSQGPATASETLLKYQARLSKCMAALGQAPPSAWAPTSLSPEELSRSESATLGALNTFAGSLQARDRLTYLIHTLANDTAYVLTQLTPQDPDARAQLASKLPSFELDLARRMTENLAEARGLCPCRLPQIEVDSSTRGSLLESARAADDALTAYLR